jgi:arylsulfatase
VERDYLWWSHEGNRAIRVGNWKLVAAAKQPWELYDLSEERSESLNLTAKMPEKASELEKLWQAKEDEFRKLATPK